MASPKFRLTCCLCGQPIPKQDVYALDAEWQRRFPDMLGTLACSRCVLANKHYWECRDRSGAYVAGHRPISSGRACTNALDHATQGTQVGMVQAHPRSGLIQGAEPYLRWAADRDTTGRLGLRGVLAEWDRATR